MADRPPLPGIPRRHLPDRREPDLAAEKRPAVPPPPEPAQPQAVPAPAPAPPPVPVERGTSPSMFAKQSRAKEYGVLLGTVMAAATSAFAAYQANSAAKPSDVQSSSAAQQQAISAAEERLRIEIGLDKEALKLRVDSLEKRTSLAEQRIVYQADMLCDANEGKPNETFPCEHYEWKGPALGHLKPKRRTDAKYPTPKE